MGSRSEKPSSPQGQQVPFEAWRLEPITPRHPSTSCWPHSFRSLSGFVIPPSESVRYQGAEAGSRTSPSPQPLHRAPSTDTHPKGKGEKAEESDQGKEEEKEEKVQRKTELVPHPGLRGMGACPPSRHSLSSADGSRGTPAQLQRAVAGCTRGSSAQPGRGTQQGQPRHFLLHDLAHAPQPHLCMEADSSTHLTWLLEGSGHSKN